MQPRENGSWCAAYSLSHWAHNVNIYTHMGAAILDFEAVTQFFQRNVSYDEMWPHTKKEVNTSLVFPSSISPFRSSTRDNNGYRLQCVSHRGVFQGWTPAAWSRQRLEATEDEFSLLRVHWAPAAVCQELKNRRPIKHPNPDVHLHVFNLWTKQAGKTFNNILPAAQNLVLTRVMS